MFEVPTRSGGSRRDLEHRLFGQGRRRKSGFSSTSDGRRWRGPANAAGAAHHPTTPRVARGAAASLAMSQPATISWARQSEHNRSTSGPLKSGSAPITMPAAFQRSSILWFMLYAPQTNDSTPPNGMRIQQKGAHQQNWPKGPNLPACRTSRSGAGEARCSGGITAQVPLAGAEHRAALGLALRTSAWALFANFWPATECAHNRLLEGSHMSTHKTPEFGQISGIPRGHRRCKVPPTPHGLIARLQVGGRSFQCAAVASAAVGQLRVVAAARRHAAVAVCSGRIARRTSDACCAR